MNKNFKCKLCFREFNNNGFGKHIQLIHKLSIQEYYNMYLKKDNGDGLCKVCQKPVQFISISAGYLLFCSHKCSSISTENKRKQTCLKKFGVPTPYQSSQIRKKGELTCFKKYGSKYPIQLDLIKNKRKQNNLVKYGVENISQLESIQQKRKKTNLDKYGYEYPIQNLRIFLKREKTYFKRKPYIFPSGNIIYLQGEEPQFLNHIIKKYNIKENTIHKEGGVFQYQDINNKSHQYYPDFFIKDLNLIVEVKSSYILAKYEKFIKEKENCVKQKGFNFILILDQNYEEFDKLMEKQKCISV